MAVAPAGTPAAVGGPAASGPIAGATKPATTVRQNLDATTKDVGTQVDQQVQNVQTQVNQVVDQVIGGPQVGKDGGDAVQQVQDTAGSVLGH